MKICTVTNCTKRSASKIGYCAFHIYRQKNNISFDKPVVYRQPKELVRQKNLKLCKNYYQKNKETKLSKDKEYYQKNKEQILAKKRVYRENNKLAINQKISEWRKNNPERVKQLNKEYRSKNFGKIKNHWRLRDKKVKTALIYLEKIDEINEIYQKCPEGMQVDHIIPITNKNVCGLHVPWNLQYLSEKDNNFKRNKFDFTYDNTSWQNKT